MSIGKAICDLASWLNEKTERRYLGPPEQWHQWFAWHWVRLSHPVNETGLRNGQQTRAVSYSDSGNYAWRRDVARRKTNGGWQYARLPTTQ
jgi:hypothetical protein